MLFITSIFISSLLYTHILADSIVFRLERTVVQTGRTHDTENPFETLAAHLAIAYSIPINFVDQDAFEVRVYDCDVLVMRIDCVFKGNCCGLWGWMREYIVNGTCNHLESDHWVDPFGVVTPIVQL
jgi:hypothetical protein